MSTTWKSLCALAVGLVLTGNVFAADHPRPADSKAHGQDDHFWVHGPQHSIRSHAGRGIARPATQSLPMSAVRR